MADAGDWVLDPRYTSINRNRIKATVEKVYRNERGDYVGVVRTADGKRYTHTVTPGSIEEREKCEAFGIVQLTELEGSQLEVIVKEDKIVGVRRPSVRWYDNPSI